MKTIGVILCVLPCLIEGNILPIKSNQLEDWAFGREPTDLPPLKSNERQATNAGLLDLKNVEQTEKVLLPELNFYFDMHRPAFLSNNEGQPIDYSNEAARQIEPQVSYQELLAMPSVYRSAPYNLQTNAVENKNDNMYYMDQFALPEIESVSNNLRAGAMQNALRGIELNYENQNVDSNENILAIPGIDQQNKSYINNISYEQDNLKPKPIDDILLVIPGIQRNNQSSAIQHEDMKNLQFTSKREIENVNQPFDDKLLAMPDVGLEISPKLEIENANQPNDNLILPIPGVELVNYEHSNLEYSPKPGIEINGLNFDTFINDKLLAIPEVELVGYAQSNFEKSPKLGVEVKTSNVDQAVDDELLAIPGIELKKNHVKYMNDMEQNNSGEFPLSGTNLWDLNQMSLPALNFFGSQNQEYQSPPELSMQGPSLEMILFPDFALKGLNEVVLSNLDSLLDGNVVHKMLNTETPHVFMELFKTPDFVYKSVNKLDRSNITSKEIPLDVKFGDTIEWQNLTMAIGPHAVVRNEQDIADLFGDAHNTTKFFPRELKASFHEKYIAHLTDNGDDNLNATQLLRNNKLTVEEHTIKTDDGYYLTLIRIPPQVQRRSHEHGAKPVVFLMHGLLGSADDWVFMGPGKSLAYLLAEAGYDVWMGNARGSKYSRRHVSIHPATNDFWHFSLDEIALHDLPAMIDYVLHASGQQRMYYVGHSQGATSFFALMSSRAEYNDRIFKVFALAPMVLMAHARSPFMKMLAPGSPFHGKMLEGLGHGEFLPSKELLHTGGANLCLEAIGCEKVCSNVIPVLAGFNPDCLDANLMPSILKRLPAGGSLRVMDHYAQGIKSHAFQKYDFGCELNEKIYGSDTPPSFKLEAVTVPVALYYGASDWLAHPSDVKQLRDLLPNVVDDYQIVDERFGHMDFVWAKDAPMLVYKRLMKSLKEH